MNERDFIYWFQGFIEMNNGVKPTDEQWNMIMEHMKLVFNKVTPELGEDSAEDDIVTIEDIKKLIKDNERVDGPWNPFVPHKPLDITNPWQGDSYNPTWTRPPTITC